MWVIKVSNMRFKLWDGKVIGPSVTRMAISHPEMLLSLYELESGDDPENFMLFHDQSTSPSVLG